VCALPWVFGAAAPGAAAEAPGDDALAVLVTLREAPDLRALERGELRGRRRALVAALRSHADRAERPLRRWLRGRGAQRVESLWIANALAVTASRGTIRALAARPEVASLRADAVYALPPRAAAAGTAAEWNVEQIRAPELWSSGVDGTGAVVATLDSGADLGHADLAGRWRGGPGGWFDPNGQHASPWDADGHGTQVLGLAVGGSAGGSSIGVAPGARWIAVKIFDDAGSASASAIHQGFQWLLDPDGDPGTDDAPDVVNASWYDAASAGACNTEFETDLEVLRAAGIAVVLAAGNAGPGASTSVSPSNLPGALAVGASDAALGVASFSSRGPSACDGALFPRLVAPGVEVRTADLSFGGLFPTSYVTVSGTSFSAPHVAGGLALLASAFPGTDVAHLERALRDTAVDLAAAGPDMEAGFGLPDLAAAHALLVTSPQCDNGRDDDGDSLVDYGEDPGCAAPWDGSETIAVFGCGIGGEIALVLPLLGAARVRRGTRRTAPRQREASS
jgi:bacillopeptidase F